MKKRAASIFILFLALMLSSCFVPGDLVAVDDYFNNVVQVWRYSLDSSDDGYNSDKGYAAKLVTGITVENLTNDEYDIDFERYLSFDFSLKYDKRNLLTGKGIIFTAKVEEACTLKLEIHVDNDKVTEYSIVFNSSGKKTVSIDFEADINSGIKILVVNPLEIKNIKTTFDYFCVRAELKE